MRVAIFVDGTLVPERDGASTRFRYLTRHLAMRGVPVIVVHSYRGWSNLELLSREPFRTFFCPPQTYYESRDRVRRLMQDEGVDIIQMNDLETIAGLGFDLAASTGCRLIYEAHYHTSTLSAQLGAADTTRALKDLEQRVTRHVDRVIAFTEADRQRWLMGGVPDDRISIIPFGIEAVREGRFPPKPRLVFFGNMFFEPNDRAVRRILSHIWPRVRAAMPTSELVLLGDIPQQLQILAESAGARVLGELEDPDLPLQGCTVGLAPVSEGTGVRAKILRYLANGIPVVASSIAAEGLSFPTLSIADSEDEFVAHCCRLASATPEESKFAETKRLLSVQYLWSDIARKTREVYASVLTTAPTHRPAPKVSTALPMWLNEVIQKGRFPSAEPPDAIVGMAGFGEITPHQW